jgi:thioredoxin 1
VNKGLWAEGAYPLPYHKAKGASGGMESKKALDLKQFENKIKSGVTLVDFNAPWCAPCRAMEPVLKQLTENFAGKAQVFELNVDENQQLAKHLDIMSIPTMIIYRQGEEVRRFIGIQPVEALSEVIENALT